ncbi:hypothetical protein BH20ACT3_BH20ACT3_05180 [soil metagenome]
MDELQPRDVVSRAETWRMQALGTDHVFLDATDLVQFDQRFPNIAAELRAAGLDPARDWLPVAPAAHYTCGGIVTDLHGATSLPGLWAAGEASCSGVHGANRLASNSLLEGMVFGPRAVEAIEAGGAGPDATGAMRSVLDPETDGPGATPEAVIGGRFVRLQPPLARSDRLASDDPAKARAVLQRQLTDHAGVLRDAPRLALAAEACEEALAVAGGDTVADQELRNLATVGRVAVEAARRREESRGAHHRNDFPHPSPRFTQRIVFV